MQFTTLFVSAATIAVVLASPVDLVARTTCSGNTFTNPTCCSEVHHCSGLSCLIGGITVLGWGTSCNTGFTECQSEVICCDQTQSNTNVNIGINLGLPCIFI